VRLQKSDRLFEAQSAPVKFEIKMNDKRDLIRYRSIVVLCQVSIREVFEPENHVPPIHAIET
jgi:hypothetical protein